MFKPKPSISFFIANIYVYDVEVVDKPSEPGHPSFRFQNQRSADGKKSSGSLA